MIVFPRDKHGNLSLAGEALQLYNEGAFVLLLSRVVVDELEEVIDRDFPEFRPDFLDFLSPLNARLLPWPTPTEIRNIMPAVTDIDDVPIIASALSARPDIVISNDFRAFHTPQMKVIWAEHDIAIESLYGLLCLFGLRERK